MLAVLFITFMMNGEPVAKSILSPSMDSCMEVDNQIADTTIRSMGGTQIVYLCIAI
jgi:hypothetical protein